ncbi:hypothetical protein B484DRAFT_461919, partial [Ochromonadaceae sp. CCMP2298]
SVQALSAPERKEFQRQQEIDRRAFQEGGHWLDHVSARYSVKAARWTAERAASDTSLGLPTPPARPPLSPFTQPKIPNTYGAGRLTDATHKCAIDVTATGPSHAESVDSDDSLPEPSTGQPTSTTARTSAPSTHVSSRSLFAAPMAQRARMQYGPPETDEDIQADLHDRVKALPRNKALTKSTSLPKCPLKLVSKASGAAKKAVSPVKTRPPHTAKTTSLTGQPLVAERPNFTQGGHFPQGRSTTSLEMQQPRAPTRPQFPTSAAVEELDTSNAAPALPSVQVYDEWGRPRPNTYAASTLQPRTRPIGDPSTRHTSSAPSRAHSATQNAQSVLGFGGTSQSAHTHEQEN